MFLLEDLFSRHFENSNGSADIQTAGLKPSQLDTN